jgi:hypothetical protein
MMAKRKKASKVQKRAKLRRGKSAKRGKARKAAPAKRTVAKAKPKRAPVKKAARLMKQPVAPAVETVAETVAVGDRATRSRRNNCHGSRGDTGQRAAACPEKNEPQPLEQLGFDAG